MQRASSRSLFRVVLYLALIVGARTYADSLGSLNGAIATDGTPATVTITCGSVTKTMQTTPGGGFSFTGLPEGTCTLKVSASGFSSKTQSITLKGAQTVKVSLSAVVQKEDEEKEKQVADKRTASETAKAEPKMERRQGPPPPPMTIAPSPSRAVAPGQPMMKKPMGGGYAIQQNRPQPIQQDRPGNTEAYDKIDDNPFHTVAANPLSTFSVDVDTASYANVRRFLEQNSMPPKDSVRIEEMINYFTYDYAAPNKGEPFSITSNVTQSPWNSNMKLVRVGIKTQPIMASALDFASASAHCLASCSARPLS